MEQSKENIVLELKGITKSFGETKVLDGIDLSIREGEFVTLLGSSGCGKTTTLRIIAGLEYQDLGEVKICGENVASVPAEKRNVNTVFQNYALFPHMNVFQNVAYGLKLKKKSKEEIRERVTKMLQLVQLEGFEKRMPSEMSGGQRQRIAIARALINEPKVLLLDEPLGALDLQLRRQMQLELKRLQKKLGITFIYITHDQEEAINMSDVIAVMHEGKFEQIGSPEEIYDHPKTSYVASFVGSANILRGTLGDRIRVSGQEADGSVVTAAVRTEKILIQREKTEETWLPATLAEKSFAGGMLRIECKLDDGTPVVISRHGINIDLNIGDAVWIGWTPDSAVLVEA